MSSPVKVLLSSFISIDRRKKDPIYLQIVYQFINAVKINVLEDGDQLPGSRKIAKELDVHRKTVVAGIEELRTQGWIETKPGVGTFVKNPEYALRDKNHFDRFQEVPANAGFAFQHNFILDQPAGIEKHTHYFTDGTPDYRVINPKELVRFYAAVLKRKHKSFDFTNFELENTFFKNQLSFYLNLTRGFHLSRQFLLATPGREQVLSILAHLLLRTGDVVLVGEWSNFLPNMIFSQAGAHLKTIPVDEEGLKVDFIRQNFQKGAIKLLYVNPRGQYPTTASLSERRRKELDDLAAAYDFVIVEDDTDCEFSSEKNWQTSLFKMNKSGRVIYTGVFGGFLLPGFQRHFMLGPQDFIAEGQKYLSLYGRPNILMEQALGEMIHEGDIHRYRRKAQQTIAERQTKFAGLLRRYFEAQIRFTVPGASLAFWLQFKNGFSLIALQKEANKLGLSIPRLCLYQNKKITALRLGFAHLNDQEMKASVQLLKKAYQKTIL